VHRSAFALQRVFQCGKSSIEFLVARPKRRLRLDAQLSCEICEREEQIAELFGRARRVLGQRAAQLMRLLFDLVHHAGGVRPIEPDRCRPAADFIGVQQSRQRLWNSRQHAARASVGHVRCALTGLDLLPLLLDVRRGSDARATRIIRPKLPARRREHMRVPPDQLGRNRPNRVGQLKRAALGGDLCMKHHLEQHVAQLVGERRPVGCVDGVECLVRFFDEMRTQRRVRLFAVPRTTCRRTKDIGHPHEHFERRGGPSRPTARGSWMPAAFAIVDHLLNHAVASGLREDRFSRHRHLARRADDRMRLRRLPLD